MMTDEPLPKRDPRELLTPAASGLLTECEAQLSATPHFGSLAPALEGAENTSRLDYVLSQVSLLHHLKNTVRGLRLGSGKTFPAKSAKDGAHWSSVQHLTGLDICQLWTIALNAGHLFGTFGTERSLLFHLDRHLIDRDEFVRKANAFEINRSTRFQHELDKGRLHSFHYLLALWRYRDGGPCPDKGLRRRARLLVAAFLDPPTEKLERLKVTFKRVRTLAYLQLHSKLNDTRYTLRPFDLTDLAKLFPVDALPEADWRSSSRWSVLEAIDRHDADTLFASTKATGEVLAHVENFRRWWAGETERTFEEKVDALFMKPDDWPTDPSKSLRHFVELRVPSSVGWIHEVRHWRHDDRETTPWDGSTFFVSPAPVGDLLRMDLYSEGDRFPRKTLEHVVVQLGRSFARSTYNPDDFALWMSTARLIALSFQTCLKEGYRLRLRPTPATRGHAGYAVAGATYEFVRARAKRFLTKASDVQRSRELRQLLSVADRDVIPWRTPTLLMLASAEIVKDAGAEPELCTELDGLAAFWSEGILNWLIVETKKSGVGGGRQQLERHLFPALESVEPDIHHEKLGQDEVWYIKLECGEDLLLPAAATN